MNEPKEHRLNKVPNINIHTHTKSLNALIFPIRHILMEMILCYVWIRDVFGVAIEANQERLSELIMQSK